ncbi:MAG: ribosome biogenesis GTPase Der, partial [Alphaproteobacteria bacterium]|nr:ribosome biogenesis GTPase Der [Alphaproteobacteria bacterium]
DNKTELKREIEDLLDFGLSEMRGVPVLTVSALRGKGLETILPAVREVYEAWNTHISTSALNRWLGQATSAHPPPAPSGRRIKLRYISQPKTRPPTFVASCNRPEALPDSYKRYLINALREDFDLWGTPIRLRLKKGDNPYA